MKKIGHFIKFVTCLLYFFLTDKELRFVSPNLYWTPYLYSYCLHCTNHDFMVLEFVSGFLCREYSTVYQAFVM
jgi:hypothetical protein